MSLAEKLDKKLMISSFYGVAETGMDEYSIKNAARKMALGLHT
jgi:hypothetical protein